MATQKKQAERIETESTYLQEMVDNIANTLAGVNAYVFLEDALDIEWVLNHDKSYKGARVLVTCGGPNIWVDTCTGTVDGYWWDDEAHVRFSDSIGLDDALKELFSC